MEETEEKWKQVKDFPNYEISTLGKLRRINLCKNSLKGLGFLNPKAGNQGYCKVTLYNLGKKIYKTIHSLVADAFLGRIPDGKEINHIDGNKSNNCITNLEYVTPKENVLHAIKTGLKVMESGSKSARAKLSQKEVEIIRKRLLNEHYVIIAKDFDVCAETIRRIKLGKTYPQQHLV